MNNTKKNQLDTLLAMFNLPSMVDFPTRIQNDSVTPIDNIFIDISIHKNYLPLPIINGLL